MQRNVSYDKANDITRGPGRLTACAAGGIGVMTAWNLFTDKQLWIGDDGHKINSIGESVRIGPTRRRMSDCVTLSPAAFT